MPLRIAFVCFLASLALSAEVTTDVKVDTPQARAVVATLQPHQRNPAVEHPMNRVLVYLTPGQMTRTNAAGKAEKIAFKAGDVRWSPAGAGYVTENMTDHAIRIAEVELKNAPPRPPMPTTKLDPTVADANHYKVELENDQVRVLRVHYGAHESGSKHEHILNRVVVYVTDQSNGKAGEVHISGAMTHSEENTLDQSVERIAVELK
jgi:quercetin dioxygenase-like cupin family protein